MDEVGYEWGVWVKVWMKAWTITSSRLTCLSPTYFIPERLLVGMWGQPKGQAGKNACMHGCRRQDGGGSVRTLPGCGEPAGGVPETGVEDEIGDAAKDGTEEPAQGGRSVGP